MIESFETLAEAMLAGELSGPDRERFVGHVTGCAECRARYTMHERLAGTLGTLDTVPLPALPDSLTSRVLSRLPGAAPWPVPAAVLTPGFALFVVGATLAALVAGALLLNSRPRAPNSTPSVRTPAPLAVPDRNASPVSAAPAPPRQADTSTLQGGGPEKARYVLMKEIGALKGAGFPPDELVAQAIRNATKKHGELAPYYQDVGNRLRSELSGSARPAGR